MRVVSGVKEVCACGLGSPATTLFFASSPSLSTHFMSVSFGRTGFLGLSSFPSYVKVCLVTVGSPFSDLIPAVSSQTSPVIKLLFPD